MNGTRLAQTVHVLFWWRRRAPESARVRTVSPVDRLGAESATSNETPGHVPLHVLFGPPALIPTEPTESAHIEPRETARKGSRATGVNPPPLGGEGFTAQPARRSACRRASRHPVSRLDRLALWAWHRAPERAKRNRAFRRLAMLRASRAANA